MGGRRAPDDGSTARAIRAELEKDDGLTSRASLPPPMPLEAPEAIIFTAQAGRTKRRYSHASASFLVAEEVRVVAAECVATETRAWWMWPWPFRRGE